MGLIEKVAKSATKKVAPTIKMAYKGAAKAVGTGTKGPGIGKVATRLYKKSPV